MEDHGHHNALPKKNLKTYWPLILVIAYILVGVVAFQLVQGFSWELSMRYFMAGFFLVFSFFKLLDLKAFARAYRSYDIPTKICPTWGYVYPFVELGLGISYLVVSDLFYVNVVTVLVMGVSIIGVIQSVLNKKEIKCACLGTGFNLPMSQVTIIEDGVMILMALIMLLN